MGAVEQREPSAAHPVRRTPVPTFLANLGVQILTEEASGARIVVIPSDVRDVVNVIDPVSSLVQADPNWTPRLSVIQLDPETHFYNQGTTNQPKLAPLKQALETIGKAIGVLETRTERVPRAELEDGEIGYRATITLRRSDGTHEYVSREKIWTEEAERAEVEDAVARADLWEYDEGQGKRVKRGKFVPGSDPYAAEVRKRWLKELKDRYAKTESKAVNRAIRAAAQIPHTFTAADAKKPFLCIGYNFTPDYNDVEVKRMLVAAGLHDQHGLYGSGSRELGPGSTPGEAPADDSHGPQGSAPTTEPAPAVGSQADPAAVGSAPSTEESGETAPSGSPGTTSEEEPGGGDGNGEQSAVSADASAQAARDEASSSSDDEPGPAGNEQESFTIPPTAIVEAAAFVMPTGRFAGKTLEQIASDPKGTEWFEWSLKNKGRYPEDVFASIAMYAEHVVFRSDA